MNTFGRFFFFFLHWFSSMWQQSPGAMSRKVKAKFFFYTLIIHNFGPGRSGWSIRWRHSPVPPSFSYTTLSPTGGRHPYQSQSILKINTGRVKYRCTCLTDVLTSCYSFLVLGVGGVADCANWKSVRDGWHSTGRATCCSSTKIEPENRSVLYYYPHPAPAKKKKVQFKCIHADSVPVIWSKMLD